MKKPNIMRIYSLNMVLVLAFILSMVPRYAKSQEAQTERQFTVVDHNSIPDLGEYLSIVDNTGNPIGKYKNILTDDGKAKREVILDGQLPVTVDAYKGIMVAMDGQRIVSIGDIVEAHVSGYCNFKVYDFSGNLIAKSHDFARFPFLTEMGSDGNFYIYGQKSDEMDSTSNLIMKLDENGKLQWKYKVKGEWAQLLYVSKDNEYIGVAGQNPLKNANVAVVNKKGKPVFESSNFANVTGMEFLPNGKLVVTSFLKFYLFDLKNNGKLIKMGSLPGNTIGYYPITYHEQTNTFIILSTADADIFTDFLLTAYDAETGQLVGKIKFEGIPYHKFHRLVRTDDNGNILFEKENEIITLKLQ